jgi:tetratricopeptide (TPR) repeat protein
MCQLKGLFQFSALVWILLAACSGSENPLTSPATATIGPSSETTNSSIMTSIPAPTTTIAHAVTPTSAVSIIDLREQANRLYEEGWSYYQADNFGEAEVSFTEALDLYIELADGRNTARAYYSLGLNYEGKEEYGQAENVYHISIMFAQQADDKEIEAKSLRRLAALQFDLDHYETKLNYSYQALSIYQELNDRPNEAEVLFYIGFAHLVLENPTEALNHLLDALDIYRDLKDQKQEALTLVWVSKSYFLLEREIEAEDAMWQALYITHQLGDPDFIWEMEDVLYSPGLFEQLSFPDATPTVSSPLALTPAPGQEATSEGFSNPISLSLSEVQEKYRPFGFEFVPTLVFCDGEGRYPRIIGANEQRDAQITACRSSENSDQLIEVSIGVVNVFNVGDVEASIKWGYIFQLFELLVPDWDERYAWHYLHVVESRKNAGELYRAQTTYQNLVVIMFAINEGTGVIFHDISIPPPMP